MARSFRVEYAGACYHVINRGNFRSKIFLAKGAAEAFERTLFEAAERFGWVVYAYVIMSNHFHICLETPEPNLSLGMKWLQGTWSMRNNRFRKRIGRPFQGRYKGILLQPEAVSSVVSYIHLNPCRAGIETAEQIGEYRWSSLSRYQSKARPEFLEIGPVLESIGGLKDTSQAIKKYLRYLEFLATDDAEQKRMLFEQMSKGWCFGSKEFKENTLKKRKKRAAELDTMRFEGMETSEIADLRESYWECCLINLASGANINLEQLPSKKSSPEKVLLAAGMKQTTSVSNGWLSERLDMGQPASVSQFVRRFGMEDSKQALLQELLSRVEGLLPKSR